MHNHITTNLVGVLTIVLSLAWSATACAQNGGGAAAELESAGGEAKFRVISRFPDEPAEDAAPVRINDGPMVDPAIRDAIAQGRWKVARLLLDKTDANDDSDIALLSAYLTLRAGAHEDAFSKLDKLAGEVDELEDYRLYWAAKSAFEAGEHHEAALRAAKVPSQSVLFGRSLILLADALIETGSTSDLEQAVETLEVYLAKYPRGRSAEDARVSLAKAYEKAERFDDAARAWRDVLAAHPLSASAKTAKARLGAIRKHLGSEAKKAIDDPPVSARMKRYRALFGAHRSEMVVAELKKELDALPADDPHHCEALYLVARSHSKLRHHTDGAPWYERVLDECKDTPYALKALYVGGKGFWNAGKRADARKWFERIWSEYADHSYADDAMYFVARILREEDDKDGARKLLKKQVDRYPKGDMAKDAHWLLVRENFAAGDFAEVVAYVDGLEETGEDDIYSRGRLHYFRARALEKLGKTGEADKAYRAVASEHPLSYYAFLSFNRLGLLAESKKSGGRSAATDLCSLQGGKLCNFVRPTKAPPVELSDELREADHFKKGAKLLRLGLTSMAEGEFQALRRRHGSEANLWALTYLLDAASAYRLSHDLARRHINGWKTHYPKSSDDPRWSLAFPQPFRKMVDPFVEKRKLPAALVYAIMREESGFNPQIESWANARGLLQLMEKTAQGVAKSDGMKDFSADKLFEPKTNIRLGTGFIEELSRELESHPVLVIAGYNAGHSNVARWLKSRGKLPLDLWVEDIPYGQTRKYTKRVLSSFWTYSWLYGQDRVPRLSFKLP